MPTKWLWQEGDGTWHAWELGRGSFMSSHRDDCVSWLGGYWFT